LRRRLLIAIGLFLVAMLACNVPATVEPGANATTMAQAVMTVTVQAVFRAAVATSVAATLTAQAAFAPPGEATPLPSLPTPPPLPPPTATPFPPEPTAAPTEAPLPPELIVETPPPPPPTAPPEAPAVTITANVNVRAGPGTEYPRLGTLAAGETFQALGKNADGTWWQIAYPAGPGGVGWVSAGYTAPNAAAAGVPVVTAPPPPTPTVTPVPPTPTPTGPQAPAIHYFTCEPCSIEPGGSSTLRWDLSGAKAAYLDGQGVTAPGSRVVSPGQTTTYRLRAVNDVGQVELAVTVEVRGLPVIHYFNCAPCIIRRGESSLLSWDLSGARAAYLDGEGVAAPGSRSVRPKETHTYRLTVVGERGQVERGVTVEVQESGAASAVVDALGTLGYNVVRVGPIPMENGQQTIAVIMTPITPNPQGREVADQVYHGFYALYQSYPDDQFLTVGLYFQERYVVLMTTERGHFHKLINGEMDGAEFWARLTWNIWDDWGKVWVTGAQRDFLRQDFTSKNFSGAR
jgi:hypothetical protein